MKYIIMCGGVYQAWEQPRHLLKVGDECIVQRTIRLLRECNVQDIAISTNNKVFEQFGVPLLSHFNSYNAKGYNDSMGYWCDAFYPMEEPVCYIFGDVIFSPQAIKIVVNTDTRDIEFFASAPPFSQQFSKKYAEPFALKVVNNAHLKECIYLTKQYDRQHRFYRKPIMWELWQVIKGTPLNHIDYTNYTVINDYTCDVDSPEDLSKITKYMESIDL